MYSKRSALKTSECDSVAEMIKKGRSSTRDFLREVNLQHYVTVKEDQRSAYKNSRSGFRTYQNKYKEFNCLI